MKTAARRTLLEIQWDLFDEKCVTVMKRFRSRLMVVGLLLILALAGWARMMWNPLRGTDDAIREWLLTETPVGLTSEEVREIARGRGWFDPFRQRSDGITSGPYIRGELGGYWTVPVYIHVSAIWVFDSSNRLSTIRIWKTVEGL